MALTEFNVKRLMKVNLIRDYRLPGIKSVINGTKLSQNDFY